MPFQKRSKSSTLNDLEGHWQPVRSAILAIAGLFIKRCVHSFIRSFFL